VFKKPPEGPQDLNLPLDIAISGVKSGLDVAAKLQKADGGDDAPQKMFANILALAAAATAAVGKLESKTGATGSPLQTGENWFKAQLGDGKLTLDGKTINIDGKTIDVKKLLARLLGGAQNLNIPGLIEISGLIEAGITASPQSKILQSSDAYQAMVKASASLSSLITALPETGAAPAISQQGDPNALQDGGKTTALSQASQSAGSATPAPDNITQLSKAQLAQLALLSSTSPAAKPETAPQPAANPAAASPAAASLQAQNAAPLLNALLANKDSTQNRSGVNQILQGNVQNAQADGLAAQIQGLFSPNRDGKSDKKAKSAFAPQNTTAFQPDSKASNPALTPFQVLQARAIAAANPDASAPGASDADTDAKALQSATNLNQTSLSKQQINVFRPQQGAYQGPQINLPNVAFEIARNLNGGNNRFQIRLDPPELGRIDILLDVKKDGAVNARLTVDRPDTLDLLQRDARALQRALVQAGLDSSQTSLEFSLKQNPFAGQGFGGGDGNQKFDNLAEKNDRAASTAPPDQAISAYRGYVAPGGVSMWV